MSTNPAAVHTIKQLCATKTGGLVTLQLDETIREKVEQDYTSAIRAYDNFAFWSNGAEGEYRPAKSLWLPQRRAIAFAHAYLLAQKDVSDDKREAALIKMPTGTGKTAVIASLACASPLLRKVLIVTPRAGLVHQMRLDLSYRFWKAFNAGYHDCEIHEGMDEESLAKFEASVKRGAISPVRLLAAEQYIHILEDRTLSRQILVSTFNALQLNLGVKPPAHRSMYGRDTGKTARVLQDLVLDTDEVNGLGALRELIKSVDAVIVDEGHYEPAYSWAQAVRAIGKPVIIFTATPYRNDYKYFQIEGRFVFNLPWEEAVRERLIREVRVEPPVSSEIPPSTKRRAVNNERSFVKEFLPSLKALPVGKKAIIHAGKFQSLKALQREFLAHGEAAVLIHERFVGDERDCLDITNIRDRKRLRALRFQHVHQTDIDVTKDVRIWMHQSKLLEGIDKSSFVEIWLYDGFGSARQLIQQVGRATRRPDLNDPDGQHAIVRGCSKILKIHEGAHSVASLTERRWQDYLAYENYAAEDGDRAFTAETQLLANVKRAAPAIQYINGEFRKGHLLDEVPTMAAFLLPRRGTVCRVRNLEEHNSQAKSDKFLDDLQSAAREAMLLEERFDIKPVTAPPGGGYSDVRLIRYLAWSNSPYLAAHHLPEWRLGVMAIVRAGRYVFVLDTESICIDFSRLDLVSPDSDELKRLFAERPVGDINTVRPRTRIVETTASGLDISELGLRAISIRKHALEEGYFDLAESSQIPTSVRGYAQLGGMTARRRLSLARSTVADATNKMILVRDYVIWAHQIADAMADKTMSPHRYFRRFARQVQALDQNEGAPTSILLDLWDILDISEEAMGDRQWDSKETEKILALDTCCAIEIRLEKEDAPPRYFFKLGDFELEIVYLYRDDIPPAGRYTLKGDALNDAVEIDAAEVETETENREFTQRLSTSLTRLINQKQAFSIVPAKRGIVYSHGHFYEPMIDEGMLSVLESCDAIKSVLSEKGDTRVKNVADWDTQTQFGLIYQWAAGVAADGDPFTKEIASCSTIICDDGSKETADFYCIDELQQRVLVIHAKADHKTAGASARELQEVTRQALASLAFAGSSRREFVFPKFWNQSCEFVLKDANNSKITKNRLVKAPIDIDISAAHISLTTALANPAYTVEIIMFTKGLLSVAAAKRARASDAPRDRQFTYFLASVRSSFDRAGVRYRIICDT